MNPKFPSLTEVGKVHFSVFMDSLPYSLFFGFLLNKQAMQGFYIQSTSSSVSVRELAAHRP